MSHDGECRYGSDKHIMLKNMPSGTTYNKCLKTCETLNVCTAFYLHSHGCILYRGGPYTYGKLVDKFLKGTTCYVMPGMYTFFQHL